MRGGNSVFLDHSERIHYDLRFAYRVAECVFTAFTTKIRQPA